MLKEKAACVKASATKATEGTDAALKTAALH
jgi:hypothetical protein